MEASEIEKGRTTIHYGYDRLGRVVQETRIRTAPEEVEAEKPNPYEGLSHWQMVDHDEVETYLKDGFKVQQHWQKGVLVVKKEGGKNEEPTI